MTRWLRPQFPYKNKLGPNGERICKWCGTPLTGRQISWCNRRECFQSYRIAQGNMDTIREVVWERDKGICQICGVDLARWTELIEFLKEGRYQKEYPGGCVVTLRSPIYIMEWKEIVELYESTGLQMGHYAHIWECDHIVPVCEGGHTGDLANFRVLCIRCHRRETKSLARKRSKAGERDRMETKIEW